MAHLFFTYANHGRWKQGQVNGGWEKYADGKASGNGSKQAWRHHTFTKQPHVYLSRNFIQVPPDEITWVKYALRSTGRRVGVSAACLECNWVINISNNNEEKKANARPLAPYLPTAPKLLEWLLP